MGRNKGNGKEKTEERGRLLGSPKTLGLTRWHCCRWLDHGELHCHSSNSSAIIQVSMARRTCLVSGWSDGCHAGVVKQGDDAVVRACHGGLDRQTTRVTSHIHPGTCLQQNTCYVQLVQLSRVVQSRTTVLT